MAKSDRPVHPRAASKRCAIYTRKSSETAISNQSRIVPQSVDHKSRRHAKLPMGMPPVVPAAPSCGVAHPASKKGMVGALVRRPEGSSMAEMVAATGWQKHTIRSVITRLRDVGCTIVCENVDGVSRYRLTEFQQVVRHNRPPRGAARPATPSNSVAA